MRVNVANALATDERLDADLAVGPVSIDGYALMPADRPPSCSASKIAASRREDSDWLNPTAHPADGRARGVGVLMW